MTTQEKVRVTVDDDKTIVEQVDIIAQRDGCTRSDVYRRAIRLLLASIPKNENVPSKPQPADIVA